MARPPVLEKSSKCTGGQATSATPQRLLHRGVFLRADVAALRLQAGLPEALRARHAVDAERFNLPFVEDQIAAAIPFLAGQHFEFDRVEVVERDFAIERAAQPALDDEPPIRQAITYATPRQQIERLEQQRLRNGRERDQLAE